MGDIFFSLEIFALIIFSNIVILSQNFFLKLNLCTSQRIGTHIKLQSKTNIRF